MTVRNKIKEFLERRPDSVTGKPGTSAYRFWKETNLSRPTAYRLVADPTYIPSGDVLDKICNTYQVQPGELLVWTPIDDTDREAGLKQDELAQLKQSRESNENTSTLQHQRTRSFLSIVSDVPQSA